MQYLPSLITVYVKVYAVNTQNYSVLWIVFFVERWPKKWGFKMQHNQIT